MNCRACNSKNLDFYITSKSQLIELGNFNFYICKDCKSLNLEANFSIEELKMLYSKDYPLFDMRRTWGKYYKFVEFEMQNVVKRRINYIKKFTSLENKFILDLGCGDGSFLIGLKNYSSNIFGFDIVKLRKDIEIFDNLDSIPYKFDIITAYHYLEHEENPRIIVDKVYELLKTGGIFIIETPKFPSFGFSIFKDKWAGLHTPRHFVVFSKKGLFTVLQRFKILKYSNFSSYSKYILYGLTLFKPNEENFIRWTIFMFLLYPIYTFSDDILTIVVKK
ncbi:MAG: class I SAM-dependent methyltransferase [candidate division WOR-3 bacterium]|nr:class I SAM-dependent methyltransferase [candidate division WOR-3 bacterium]